MLAWRLGRAPTQVRPVGGLPPPPQQQQHPHQSKESVYARRCALEAGLVPPASSNAARSAVLALERWQSSGQRTQSYRRYVLSLQLISHTLAPLVRTLCTSRLD